MLTYFGIVPEGSLLDVPNAALGTYLFVFPFRMHESILGNFPLWNCMDRDFALQYASL